MGAVVGGVELYMGPVALGAPDDLDAIIRDFVDDAKHSLAIAVQEVDSRSIADAILTARAQRCPRAVDPRGRLPDGGTPQR